MKTLEEALIELGELRAEIEANKRALQLLQAYIDAAKTAAGLCGRVSGEPLDQWIIRFGQENFELKATISRMGETAGKIYKELTKLAKRVRG